MSIFDLDMKAKEYFAIVAQIASLEEEKKALQAIFQNAMVEIEREEINGHNWRATWHNTTRKSLDTKGLEKAFPDVYSQFLKETTSTRFTLNQIKSA